MAFDPTTPVLDLIIEADDDVATVRLEAVKVSGRIAEIIAGDRGDRTQWRCPDL